MHEFQTFEHTFYPNMPLGMRISNITCKAHPLSLITAFPPELGSSFVVLGWARLCFVQINARYSCT